MKVLVSDFDKTIYIKNEESLMKNISAIKNFIKEGNLFCIITGRNYTSIKPLLTQYKIPYNYLICEDGAKIFNSIDYCIQTTPLPEEKISKIISLIPKDIPYFLDDGYNNTLNKNDCVKIAIPYKNRESAYQLLNRIKEVVSVYIYMSIDYINITDKNVHKFNAIKNLIDLENINKNSVYVIGDSINDLEMLSNFKGAIMKEHNESLDNLGKQEYEYLYEYIEQLRKII